LRLAHQFSSERREQRGDVVAAELGIDPRSAERMRRGKFSLALLEGEDLLLDAAGDDQLVDENRLVLTRDDGRGRWPGFPPPGSTRDRSG
jgi:hypothetical protein